MTTVKNSFDRWYVRRRRRLGRSSGSGPGIYERPRDILRHLPQLHVICTAGPPLPPDPKLPAKQTLPGEIGASAINCVAVEPLGAFAARGSPSSTVNSQVISVCGSTTISRVLASLRIANRGGHFRRFSLGIVFYALLITTPQLLRSPANIDIESG